MESIVEWLYASGDPCMMVCRIVAYIFAFESLAYLVSIVMGVSKTACK